MAPKTDKKKEGGGSNVVSMFEQNQIQEFKETFTIMDQNSYGIIRSEGHEGPLCCSGIKYHLLSQADKFTEDEVNRMFTNFPLDHGGNLDYKSLCYVITHGEDKELEKMEKKQKDEKWRRKRQRSLCL